jgi:hypothetical protein
MKNNYFRIILEIEGNYEDGVFSITEWINSILEDHASDVGHISVTEIIKADKKGKCSLGAY